VAFPAAARSTQWPVVGTALAVTGVLALAIAATGGGRMVALFGVGLLLGVALYHAAFGFTSAYRVLLADGQGAAMRAQIVMLALACVLFFPAIGAGQVFGAPVAGHFGPLGPPLLAGAFMFGIGMQLGGGCASGTLFAVGGGSARMVLTLACFVLGSVAGVAHLSWWSALPSLPPVSLVAVFGWPVALAGNLLVFALLWWLVVGIERRRHGTLAPIGGAGRLLRGPWPLLGGAVALAVLNFATLLLAGRPWGITSAFGPWGGKLLRLGGIDVGGWGGWMEPAQQAALARPVLADITSVMDFGIMLGALLAAGAAGRFAPWRPIPARHAMASVIGGLLMGYGARLATGCNIGAFFSGVASGSLHGWLWIACALAGTFVALPLRRAFGMAVERRATAC
jgi:uncharacterized membrane protein YedE/YeeE